MLGRRTPLLLALLGGCVCLAVLFTAASPGLSVLDQYEIGEYENDPLESEATEREFEKSRPWRDPGHISRCPPPLVAQRTNADPLEDGGG